MHEPEDFRTASRAEGGLRERALGRALGNHLRNRVATRPVCVMLRAPRTRPRSGGNGDFMRGEEGWGRPRWSTHPGPAGGGGAATGQPLTARRCVVVWWVGARSRGEKPSARGGRRPRGAVSGPK